jgi:hypothetical protein
LVRIRYVHRYSPPVFCYEELAERTLGKFGKGLLSFFIAVTTFLANAAHLKTVTAILRDTLEWFVTG